MRYLTKHTINARLVSSPNVAIYIPPQEVVETDTGESTAVMRVIWRGQILNADITDLDRKRSLQPA
jgi:hypothetical protein